MGKQPRHGRCTDGIVQPDDEEIVAELYPSLRRLAAVVRPIEVDADDLVQDAIVRTLAIRPLRDCDIPGAYLGTAIVRAASNQRRRLGRQRRAYLRVPRDSGARRAAEYPSDLDDLRRLHPRDRALLYLAVVEGQPYREIARVLECSEEAARARAARALHRLRVELREEAWDA